LTFSFYDFVAGWCKIAGWIVLIHPEFSLRAGKVCLSLDMNCWWYQQRIPMKTVFDLRIKSHLPVGLLEAAEVGIAAIRRKLDPCLSFFSCKK